MGDYYFQHEDKELQRLRHEHYLEWKKKNPFLYPAVINDALVIWFPDWTKCMLFVLKYNDSRPAWKKKGQIEDVAAAYPVCFKKPVALEKIMEAYIRRIRIYHAKQIIDWMKGADWD